MTTQAEHRRQRARTFTHCQRCGKPKTTPATRQKDVPRTEYECDPYCSRPCAEADHGIKDPHSPTISTQGRIGKQGGRSP